MRKYWSQRKGLSTKYDLNGLNRAVKSVLFEYNEKGYFQEYFGYECVDEGYVSGKAGLSISNFIFRKLKREISWPLEVDVIYDEDVLFDLVELVFDIISKPIDGYFHSYANCGYHYSSFDSSDGQIEYRNQMNDILPEYSNGYELNSNGEICLLLSPGLNELTESKLPTGYNEIESKIDRSVRKFRDRHSSFDDRKEAVRLLADVLESIRSDIKEFMLSKDESELFNIANNYAIRHDNERQKKDYSIEWLCWIFYLYLSTIHLCLRIKKNHPTTPLT